MAKQLKPYNVADRLKGVLPTISIAGEDFIVDIQKHELRLERNPEIKIDLKKMDLTADGERLVGFYNPSTYKQEDIDFSTERLPEGAIIIEMSNEFGLDPVGFAMRLRVKDKALLEKYAKARVTKVSVYPPKLSKGEKEQARPGSKTPKLIKRKRRKRL